MLWQGSSTSFSSLGSCGTTSPNNSNTSQEFDNNEIPIGPLQVRQRRMGLISPCFDYNYGGSEFNEALFNLSQTSLNLQNNTILYCTFHNYTHDCYCQTCCKTLCCECEMNYHEGHQIMPIVDALEKALTQSRDTIEDARKSMNVLNDDIKVASDAKEDLHQKSITAQADVISSINRMKAALDARQDQLIDEIKLVEQQKYKMLEARQIELKQNYDTLQRAAESLCHLNRKPISKPVDTMKFLVTEDILTAEVFIYTNLIKFLDIIIS